MHRSTKQDARATELYTRAVSSFFRCVKAAGVAEGRACTARGMSGHSTAIVALARV
jgi:hypothetical protein